MLFLDSRPIYIFVPRLTFGTLTVMRERMDSYIQQYIQKLSVADAILNCEREYIVDMMWRRLHVELHL